MIAQQKQMKEKEKEDARKDLEREALNALNGQRRAEWERQRDLDVNWWEQEQPPQPAAQPSQPTNAMDVFSTDLGQDSVGSILSEFSPKKTNP
jgi:hypothetical protein